MAPHDLRRPFKRAAMSDQQKRREVALQRQAQNRHDSQHHARSLASSILSLQNPEPETETVTESEPETEIVTEPESPSRDFNISQASKLKGSEARRWFARQLMLPEWMIDVPPRLSGDWYVFPRPAGKRCFVVSSNGTTVSRLRNGSLLHHFPSALPNGARKKDISGPAQSYCILDCIFHELDQTYYVIDMVCWRGYSLYDCSAEFRFFWLNSKLDETGACNSPSIYHKYRFSAVPVYDCDQMGMHAAYTGAVPYDKDGLLFYNKHAHYQTGNTPLALVWKDEKCSQYVIDTDSKGQVPAQQQGIGNNFSQELIKSKSVGFKCIESGHTRPLHLWKHRKQQVVLELQYDGKVSTSDDSPVVFGCLDGEFLQKLGLRPGTLLRFAISDGGMKFVDGKLEMADIHYVGKVNRARAFADSYSKVLFQYTARHSPLGIDDLIASIYSYPDQGGDSMDVEVQP